MRAPYDFSHWNGQLPKVSCLCLTYGRPHLLGEAIESFLRQDYPGEKELIILNDHPEMPLSIPPCEGVTLINASERYPSLGHKRNALAELASGDLFFPWDDDDISLPWRISLTVSKMRNLHYFKPTDLWWWTGKGADYHCNVMAHAMCGYSRELFHKIGGYPEMNSGEDQGIERAIARHGMLDTASLGRNDAFYIYRLNHINTYHISAHSYGGGWEECAAEVAERVPNGEKQIHAGWSYQYEEVLVRHAERRKAFLDLSSDRPLLSICIALKNRSRVPHNNTFLELFPNCIRSIREAASHLDGEVEVVIADFSSDDWPLQDWINEAAGDMKVTLLTVEEHFSRGRGLNHAAVAASSSNLLLCDADILIDGKALEHGLELLANGETWFPAILNLKPNGETDRVEVDGFGISFVNRALFLRAGGFPEFESWGGEDNIFRDRISALTPIKRAHCEGLRHQWHPDSIRDTHYRHERRTDFRRHLASPSPHSTILALESEGKLRTFEAKHPYWSDHLHMRPCGFFYRPGSDHGRYEITEDGQLVLRWDRWPEEILRWSDSERIYQAANGFSLKELLSDSSSQDGATPLTGQKTTPIASPDINEENNSSKTIVLMATYDGAGLPHLGRLLQSNPGIPVHVIHGPRLQGDEKKDAWRNCDRAIRRWWLEQGQYLPFDRVIFLEHDVLFDADIDEVFSDEHFVVRNVHRPDSSDWGWIREAARLPKPLDSYATGISPLAAMAISRECLCAMMSHPLAEEAFSRDVFCETRFPTLATACGYPPVASQDTLPNLDWKPIAGGSGRGVWHSVKQ